MEAASSPTIRSRLTLLVLAAVIPASVMAAVLISYNYKEERARQERNAIATARAMVQGIDRELLSVMTAAQVLATSPYLQDGDLRRFYDQAKSVVELQIGSSIVLYGADGQMLLSTLRPFGGQLPRITNDVRARLIETRRPVLSDLFIGPVTRRPVISVEIPIFHGDQFIYGLAFAIPTDRFSDLLRNEHLPPGWIVTVFDSSGTIVARTHEMDRFLGKKDSPELISRMMDVNEDALPTVSVEGIAVLSAFSRSDAFKWAVAIGIPSASLTRQLWASLALVIVGSTALAVASGLLAWRVGGQIAASIHGLIAPALAIGMGKVVAIPSLHFKEADEVGQALARASRMLRDAEHRANHDSLSGLPNRELFEEVANQRLALCRREGGELAILYVDLDDFKSVNDGYGHAVGDELLCAVAARLRNSIRGDDVAARFGGDEFVVLLTDTPRPAAATVANNLVDVLSRPYPIGPLTLRISASIGVAAYPSSDASISTLVANADAAMYKAKKAGKRRAAFADAA